MVLHQPIPRRAYASTLPHPQPPTPTSQGPALSILTNPGNSNTWTPGAALRSRPHSIATTPQTAPMPPASPSDSGYRSLPSAASDYQILKSPSSGGTGSSGTRSSTPATSPATPLTTSQAIQQLLAQPRNGFKIVDDKVSLFIEILDTQERFAKVSRQSE
ncbi:Dystrophin, isoform D [Habropoda laboriosa]|uniref:Dystrophin, isoform D n=1 Tax=Habropoda laboriosa TaxID=597456 RepID=A0A0L7R7Z4_9HYME|nr:Dystrophin, isoform D [Habropoda laboriosa]